MNFKLSERTKFGYTIIDITGDISFDDSKKIVKYIDSTIHQFTTDVILNLQNVSYINSSALSELVKISHKLSREKIKTYLMNVNEEVTGLLKMTGVNRVFVIIPDEKFLLEELKEKDLKRILESEII